MGRDIQILVEVHNFVEVDVSGLWVEVDPEVEVKLCPGVDVISGMWVGISRY